MHLALLGDPRKPGPLVPRRFLSALAGPNPPAWTTGSGRLQLAEAIASPANSLSAHVMVYRVWQHHFGRPLVATPSNFGLLGEKPSHPELLDRLTARFVADGWSLKKLWRFATGYAAITRKHATVPRPRRAAWDFAPSPAPARG